MNNTSQTLRRTMKAIVDATPEPPELGTVRVTALPEAEAVSSRRRPVFSAALAVAAVAVVGLVGFVALVLPTSSDREVGSLGEEVATDSAWIVIAFATDELDQPEASTIEALRLRPEVTDILIVDKDQARIEATELFADDENLLRVLDENPGLLPASIRVRTGSLQEANAVADFASGLSGVQQTDSYFGEIGSLKPLADDTFFEYDTSPVDTTTTLPTYFPVLDALQAAAMSVEPPSGLTLLGGSIDEVSSEGIVGEVGETVILAQIKYGSGSGSVQAAVSVQIVLNAPWDPEKAVADSGGEMKRMTLSVIGEVLVVENEFTATISWPLPDDVTVGVIGRGVAIEDLRPFAERLNTQLITVTAP